MNDQCTKCSHRSHEGRCGQNLGLGEEVACGCSFPSIIPFIDRSEKPTDLLDLRWIITNFDL